MKDWETLLSQGLEILCKNDADIEALIAPRYGDVFSLLCRYIKEIELFNKAYGLVGAQSEEELIIKHILDSLAPINSIVRLMEEQPHTAAGPKGLQVADVGSGAGLPGIPLAVCMPGVEFTLIERMGRRAGFLRDVLAVLGLPNVRVEEAEIEKLSQNPAARGSFDLAVFRAFKPLDPAIFRHLLKLLTPGWVLAAYKGRRESVEEEMARLLKSVEKGAGPSVGYSVENPAGSWELIPLEVPFLEEERHLLVIKP